MVQIPEVVFGNVKDAVVKHADLGESFFTGSSLDSMGGLHRPHVAYPKNRAKWDAFFTRKAGELGDYYPQWLVAGVVPELAVPQKITPERPTELKESNPKDYAGLRKIMFSVLPWRVLHWVALALSEGMWKYGKFNYRETGVRASVYFDAVVARHLSDWWEGTDIDPDSGLHHVDKAIAGLLVMRDSMLCGNFIDDRPPSQPINFAELNAHHLRLQAMHADKHPKHYTIQDKLGE